MKNNKLNILAAATLSALFAIPAGAMTIVMAEDADECVQIEIEKKIFDIYEKGGTIDMKESELRDLIAICEDVTDTSSTFYKLMDGLKLSVPALRR